MNRKTSTLLSMGISIALIAAGIWFLCSRHDSLGFGAAMWLMPGRIPTGIGMGIVMILFWVTLLAAIVLIISGAVSGRHSSDGVDDSASQILKQRYARGEIDKNQFDQMKRDLH